MSTQTSDLLDSYAPDAFDSVAPYTGRVTGASAVGPDITDRKRAEADTSCLDDEIQRQRLRVFKATMTTVQHIVNNALNNLQFVRLEAEGRLSEEMLALFDQVINDAAVHVKALGDLQSVKEKNIGFGIGIEYPVAGDVPK